MNRRNIRKAINYLVNSPPPVFNMTRWFSAKTLDDPLNDRLLFSAYGDLQDAIKNGILPAEHACGTSACLAGTIQYNAAKTEDEKNEFSRNFARDFLDISFFLAEGLFEERHFYNRQALIDVTIEDVINALIILYNVEQTEDNLMYLSTKMYLTSKTIDQKLTKIKPSKRISRSDFGPTA